MPAAAVIPAPIAYINVVAVKKLVVEVWGECSMTFLKLLFVSPLSNLLVWVLSYLY